MVLSDGHNLATKLMTISHHLLIRRFVFEISIPYTPMLYV